MDLTAILGTEPVADAEEEAFVIFSQDIPSQSLGFIDVPGPTLDITVAGHDLTIHQSRGLLNSDRKEGTTGAVIWTVTPLLATWLCSPTNFLTTHSLLTPSTTVLELGAGVSGIVALCLAPKVAQYTATDQSYVLKLLRQNIAENLTTVFPRSKPQGRKGGGSGSGSGSSTPRDITQRIQTHPLDWELSSVSSLSDTDILLACDCIYNESLIEPLNSTCTAICRLRQEKEPLGRPTLCIIAQQVRAHEVFEMWLESFMRAFEVWRVPEGLVGEGLGEGSGFVVHVGVLKR